MSNLKAISDKKSYKEYQNIGLTTRTILQETLHAKSTIAEITYSN